MTRRILLTLAEDTTGDECGACPNIGEPHGHWCSIWGAIHCRKRAAACIAAEREADALRLDAVRLTKQDAGDRRDWDECERLGEGER